MDQTLDANNNDAVSTKYSLRPRTTGKRPEDPMESRKTTCRKTKKGSQPLSKYRRRSANARERTRMREINEAFESLRRVVTGALDGDFQGDKMTKISTLRLAMKYITALSEVLSREPSKDEQSILVRSARSFTEEEASVKTFSPVPSVFGQFVTVNNDLSTNRKRTLPHKLIDNSRHLHSFEEPYITDDISEQNSNCPLIHAACHESIRLLQPADTPQYPLIACSRSNDNNAIVTDPSRISVISPCVSNSFNCAPSTDSAQTPLPSEQPFEQEPPCDFDVCQPLLLSNIQSLPLQTISLDELLITR